MTTGSAADGLAIIAMVFALVPTLWGAWAVYRRF